MKKLFMVLFAVIIAGSVIKAQVNQNFTIINKTGLAIDQLYVSPSEVEDWEEDVLGVDVLQNGEQADIHFSPKEERCQWDIKVVDGNGDSIIWTDIDLCKAQKVTLNYENGAPTATIEDAEEQE
jgi:hypothetical protein